MSIIYCKKHSQKWDSDRVDECPVCENEHPEVSDDELVKRLRGKGGHYYELRHEAADRIEELTRKLEAAVQLFVELETADALDRYELTKEIYSGSRFGKNHNG